MASISRTATVGVVYRGNFNAMELFSSGYLDTHPTHEFSSERRASFCTFALVASLHIHLTTIDIGHRFWLIPFQG